MSDPGKRPKVLGFLMANGLMMASEGTLLGMGESKLPGFYHAQDIETGEWYYINFRHVLQVREVNREDVFRTGKIIKPGAPGGRFN